MWFHRGPSWRLFVLAITFVALCAATRITSPFSPISPWAAFLLFCGAVGACLTTGRELRWQKGLVLGLLLGPLGVLVAMLHRLFEQAPSRTENDRAPAGTGQ